MNRAVAAVCGVAALALAVGVGPAAAAPTSTPAAPGTSATPTSASASASATTPTSASASATQSGTTGGSQATPVTVTLTSMTPHSPSADLARQNDPIVFTATVSNNTDTTYTDFSIGLERAAPLTSQQMLDQAIAQPPSATDNTLAEPYYVDQQRGLAAHASVSVRYVTDASAQRMCLCFTGVFPYALVVRAESDPSIGFTEVGRTQVLVPSFLVTPRPVAVSWVWPLLDRPHRAFGDTVFSDDDLTASVSPGGRLYRALSVAEAVSKRAPMTVLSDPDLLDSLAVMASPGGYTYQSGKSLVKGQGGPAAAAWLARLRALNGLDSIELTAYADPDVNAVTRAGLPYSTALDPQVKARITAAIGSYSQDLSWPAGGSLTSKALDSLIASGASTIVLNDAALPGQNTADPRPNALSPLPSANGQSTALVTDGAIERTVGSALALGSTPAQSIQTLISQLAIRAAVDPEHGHYVVLTPPRYVDTDPKTAAAVILATATNSWSVSTPIAQALGTVTPVDRGPLQTSAESPAGEVNAAQLGQLLEVQGRVASLRDALQSDASAALLGGFAPAIQRAQSTAWRSNPALGETLTTSLADRVGGLLGSVFVTTPPNSTYGLSSGTSPIIVTVRNNLSQDVTTRVQVSAGSGTIGFSSTAEKVVIPANSTKTVNLPARVERLGQFKVTATVSTPDGQQFGNAVPLSLRSTAIGGITKVITILAAAVLVFALLRRLVRRLRRGSAVGVPA